jgi:hypothetical protein
MAYGARIGEALALRDTASVEVALHAVEIGAHYVVCIMSVLVRGRAVVCRTMAFLDAASVFVIGMGALGSRTRNGFWISSVGVFATALQEITCAHCCTAEVLVIGGRIAREIGTMEIGASR